MNYFTHPAGYDITVLATDSNGQTIHQNYVVNVNPEAPTALSFSSSSLIDNASIAVTAANGSTVANLFTTDNSADNPQTYIITSQSAPGAFSLSSNNLIVNSTSALVGGASDTVTIQDTNVNGQSITHTFTIAVNDVAPVANNDAYSLNYSHGQSNQINLPILSNDIDHRNTGSLTSTIASGPADGTLFLNSNGSYTYTANANFSGVDTFTYTVNDGLLNSNTATVTINVDAPSIASPDTYSIAENNPLIVNAAAGILANDANHSSGPLSIVLVNAPSHASLFSLNISTGAFDYTPSSNFSGIDSFSYKLSDGSVTSNTVTVTLNVIQYPLTNVPITPTVVEGNTFMGAVAHFTDTYSAAQPSDFSSVITWNDNTTSIGTVQANVNGGYDIIGTKAFGNEGSYAISVAINNKEGPGIQASNTITVTGAAMTNVPITPNSVTEGSTFSGTVAHFTDAYAAAPASDFSAVITWSDNTTSTGTIQTNINGGYDVIGTKAFSEEGTYAVKVAINDKGRINIQANNSITVTDAPITASGDNISPIVNVGFSGAVATFHDGNINAPIGDFTASINWGDSTSSSGTIVSNGSGNFTVDGTHTYVQTGSNNIQVSIIDVGSSHVNAAGIANVLANLPVTANNDSFHDQINSNGSPVQLAVTALNGVTANDTNPSAIALTAQIVSGTSHGSLHLNVDGSFTYTPNAGFTGVDTFTYRDVSGSSVSNIGTATIAVDTSPTIVLAGKAATYTQGQANPTTISPTATVMDPDTQFVNHSTLTIGYKANGSADDRLAIVSGGDLTISGNNIIVNGVQVGTSQGGVGLTPLVVTFNSAANAHAVQDVVDHIAYSNVSTLPATLTRQVSFSLKDGSGQGYFGNGASQVVQAVNFNPISTEAILHQSGFIDFSKSNTIDNIGQDLGLYISTKGINSTDFLQVDLQVYGGDLNFSSYDGLDGLIFKQKPDKNGLSSIEIKGTVSELNLALSRLTYTSTHYGLDVLTTQIIENGTTSWDGGDLEYDDAALIVNY